MTEAGMTDAAGGALAGRRVMVPETRELDLFARMLERQGAATLRCPLVAILDAPDPAPVEAWLRRFVARPPDDIILLTGEGLGRLLALAGRCGIEAGFVAALAGVRKIVRGPKPTRRLRSIGQAPDLSAEQPTSAGVIAVLAGESLAGRRVAVQLYPGNPDPDGLLTVLRQAGAAADPVLPYAYASEADDQRVVEAIDEMAAGRIDLIAFTSAAQPRRLQTVAAATGRAATLQAALARTRIAAVGPVVARAVEELGGQVTVTPEDSFHMKPLVTAIVAAMR